MEQTHSELNLKKNQYLFQHLNLTIVSLWFAITISLLFFWDFETTRSAIIQWYILNLVILILRGLTNFYYNRRKAEVEKKPLLWSSIYIAGACLNAILIACLAFLLPEQNFIYFSYLLLLIGLMSIAAITSIGTFRLGFFIYLSTLSLPIIIFYSTNAYPMDDYHIYGYIVVFSFSAMSALNFNKSLTTTFRMELENHFLKSQLSSETSSRLGVESELLKKAKELESLNKSLEEIVKEKTSELETLAFYDTLTQLPNRHHFYNYLERTLARNQVNQETFALFFIDLDEFKAINDTLGHDIGDKLLIEVSSRLRTCTRVDDFIARISGDEFIVIIKGVSYESELASIATNIIRSIAQPYPFFDSQAFISCSIGIAKFPDDGTNLQSLFKYADLAMYNAKENGKNSFKFYNQSLYEQKAKKFILATELKSAIERKELHLVYQPKVNANTNEVNSMEVLLRWNSHKFGPVPVFKFISLAEESKQILELEKFVLTNALTQVMEWNKKSRKPFTIGINISNIHFQQKDFVEEIEQLLEALHFNPFYLELELTESAIMKDIHESVNKLNLLKYMGIHISIDDFGTGYSSMSYLKQLPIDTLKIDKSFIDGIPDDKDNCAITQAIIMLAQQFKLKTIAEGVESLQQLEYLKQSGCHLIQGFYFYKPLSTKEFESRFIQH
jgi:diguanylate cyclase (GGDEF)-like protein